MGTQSLLSYNFIFKLIGSFISHPLPIWPKRLSWGSSMSYFCCQCLNHVLLNCQNLGPKTITRVTNRTGDIKAKCFQVKRCDLQVGLKITCFPLDWADLPFSGPSSSRAGLEPPSGVSPKRSAMIGIKIPMHCQVVQLLLLRNGHLVHSLL